MPFEIRTITKKAVWESFIKTYGPQCLFQSWNWGEVILTSSKLKKTPFSPVVRIGIYEDDQLQGIASVHFVSVRRGVYMHIRHGPILRNWNNLNVFSFLVNYLRSEGNKRNVLFTRLSPLIPNSAENINLLRKCGCIDAPIHAMDGEYCWVLDLDKSEEELLSGMRKTTRYLIRQAVKTEVKITQSTNIDDLSDFFNLYEKTAQRHHFVAHTGIEEEFNIFLKDKEICLFKGFYQQKLISTALILFYQNQAIYHHSASIDQKIPVNYLLQWEVIKEAKSRGMKIYNFWGIAPENSNNHPWRGLTLFKKGFGGRTIEYLHAKDIPFRFGYWKSYAIDLLRKFKKGY